MATSKLPHTAIMLETRDIIGFSADYIMQNIHQFEFEREREIMYTICSNLYRAEHILKIELLAAGLDVKERIYDPHSFKDVSYLSIKIKQIVEEFVEKQKNDIELAHYRKVL